MSDNYNNQGQDLRRVVIVTGMSGAGKTVGLHALEDLGFEAVDNIPLRLVESLIFDNAGEAKLPPLAVGIDSRSRAFTPEHFVEILDQLKKHPELDLSVVYFDCDDTILVNRYSEHRRAHHMALDRPIRDGIAIERKMLAPIRRRADSLMDTSNLTTAVAKRRVQDRYRTAAGSQLLITVISFGYSRGVPRDVDLVMDLRFLRNPHYDPELRPLTGQDERVVNYVMADGNFGKFEQKMDDLIDFLIPLYVSEGKHYLTVGFGCTGGKHRSVMFTERVGKKLQDMKFHVNIIHRDMPRMENE